MKTRILFNAVLCFLLSFPFSYGSNIDSLQLVLAAEQGAERLNIYLNLADRSKGKDPQKSIHYLNQALADSIISLDPRSKNILWRKLARMYSLITEFDKAFKAVNQARGVQLSSHHFSENSWDHIISSGIISNSALEKVNYSKIDQIETKHMQALIYSKKADYQKALFLFDVVSKFYDSLGINSKMSRGKKDIGLIYHRQANYPKALEYYDEAIELAKGFDNRGLVSCSFNKAIILNNYGKPVEALNCFFDFIEYKTNGVDSAVVMLAHFHIAFILETLTLRERALQYYQHILPYYRRTHLNDPLSILLEKIGGIYVDLEQYDQALKYLQESLEIKEKHNLGLTGASFLGLGKIYYYKGKDSLAIDYLNKGLDVFKGQNNKSGISMIYNTFAKINLKNEKFQKAKEYSLAAVKLSKEINLVRNLKDSYESLATIYTHFGDYENALVYQNLLQSVKDSLYSVEKIESITRKLIGKTLTTKEKEISDLRLLQQKNNAQLQHTQKEASSWRFLVLIISFLSCLTVVFFIKRIKKRKKEKDEIVVKLKQTTQTKEKLTQKLEELEKNKVAAAKINRATSDIGETLDEKQFVLLGAKKYTVLQYHKIIKITSQDNYSQFYLEGDKDVTSSYSLKHFEAILPEDMFFRVHKSYIINLKKVVSYDLGRSGSVLLSDGSSITIAARRKSAFTMKMHLSF